MVKEFLEKPQSKGGLINGVFFVFQRKVLDYLADRDDCDLEYQTLELLTNEGQLMVYHHNGFSTCMDTIRDVDYLNKLCAQDKPPWKVWES
jgi:glucose-1-phosphate cytidylyltransferase